jgi:hypothetical protein
VIEVIKELVGILEKNKIDYMIVGSIASTIYGEPRMTRDVDFVITLGLEDSGLIDRFFPEADYYCPPKQIIDSEIINCGQFNLIHHASGFKVDFMIRKKDEHSLEEFKRRKKLLLFDDFEAFVASAEDVILKKMVFYKMSKAPRHISDIEGIVSTSQLNQEYIQKWSKVIGVQDIWNSIIRC